MVVGGRRAGLSILETADLLGFSWHNLGPLHVCLSACVMCLLVSFLIDEVSRSPHQSAWTEIRTHTHTHVMLIRLSHSNFLFVSL